MIGVSFRDFCGGPEKSEPGSGQGFVLEVFHGGESALPAPSPRKGGKWKDLKNRIPGLTGMTWWCQGLSPVPGSRTHRRCAPMEMARRQSMLVRKAQLNTAGHLDPSGSFANGFSANGEGQVDDDVTTGCPSIMVASIRVIDPPFMDDSSVSRGKVRDERSPWRPHPVISPGSSHIPNPPVFIIPVFSHMDHSVPPGKVGGDRPAGPFSLPVSPGFVISVSFPMNRPVTRRGS